MPELLKRVRLLVIFMVSAVESSTAVGAQSAKTISQVHQICHISPSQCISAVDKQLKNTPLHSRTWFALVQDKIDALFNLQENQQIVDIITPWLEKEDIPVTFKTSIYIHYAKQMRIKKPELAQLCLEKARILLEQINQAYPTPIRFVELANLFLVMGENQKALETLTKVESKFAHYDDPYFKLELYGNLGHVTRQMEAYQQSISYWHESIKWGKEFGNLQQLATVEYNLARVYFLTKQYAQAKPYFESVLTTETKTEDFVKANNARAHLVDIYCKQGLVKQADSMQEQINTNYLSPQHKALLSKENC